MRHQITISSQAKVMLSAVRIELGKQGLSYSAVTEMCIRSAFDNLKEGNCFHKEMNPTQQKLDEILGILHEQFSELY